MYCKISCETWLVIFGTLLAILLRVSTGLHSYSGEATPPMYGDYEAQRHWMEVTTNLPVSQWYQQSKDNDLNYWGLDYPPLTAYHMYVCGKIAGYLNENYTKLHDSRGYESEPHKTFMRYTVLICDLTLYIPTLILYFYSSIGLGEVQHNEIKKKKLKAQKTLNEIKPMSVSLSTVLALLYPGIILIDHGHFQYNCVSLGLAVMATTCLLHERNIFASFLFCLALNYKQMELYHALPFFFYLLSSCVPKPGQGAISGFAKLFTIGLTVLVSFGIIWSPFLYRLEDMLQVLHRQFPIARGVFEDKVANVWCALNVIFKFKTRFDNMQMMRICLFATLSALFPSSVDLFLRPNLRKFVLALINSSLAFFLFSFQVHEKSILLVSTPVLLYFPYSPFPCFWFLCMSVFSMTPLLIKDNLAIAVIALMTLYTVSFRVSIEHAYRSSLNTQDGLAEYYRSLLHTLLDIEYKKSKPNNIIKITFNQIKRNSEAIKTLVFHFTMFLSLFVATCLFFASLVFKPPARYPDLYPLLISTYSCIHFIGFFIYFNVKQLRIPQQFEAMKNVKLKNC
ncbi:ALG6 alpha-1,3-glucosyltransferase garnysstan [Leptinotarsa decemlineata]|uniref:ALG6 alpha-1,3-glucosyltransferase garnysstan n=1 Tax=Leptinotarsa decemlineata TaxID=7539 RepID=UPI003D30726A